MYVIVVADDKCTVTSINPTFLTATGGRLFDGMTNVKINFKCATSQYPEDTMWYYPNGTILPLQLSSTSGYQDAMQQNGTLIIPRFSQLHEGMYYCWVNGSTLGTRITLELLQGKCASVYTYF